MGLPKGFTLEHIGCLLLLCVGIILHIVGLATPCWTQSNFATAAIQLDATYGLWRACLIGNCHDLTSEELTDSWKAARAFGILSTLAGLGILGLACVYFLMKFADKSGVVLVEMAILTLSIVSLLFMIIGTSCYGGGVHVNVLYVDNSTTLSTSIGYSLILYVIGGIITCIGGVLFFVVSVRKV